MTTAASTMQARRLPQLFSASFWWLFTTQTRPKNSSVVFYCKEKCNRKSIIGYLLLPSPACHSARVSRSKPKTSLYKRIHNLVSKYISKFRLLSRPLPQSHGKHDTGWHDKCVRWYEILFTYLLHILFNALWLTFDPEISFSSGLGDVVDDTLVLSCHCRDLHRRHYVSSQFAIQCSQDQYPRSKEEQARSPTRVTLQQLQEKAHLGCHVCAVIHAEISEHLPKFDSERQFVGLFHGTPCILIELCWDFNMGLPLIQVKNTTSNKTISFQFLRTSSKSHLLAKSAAMENFPCCNIFLSWE